MPTIIGATFYCLPQKRPADQEPVPDFRENLGEFISTQQIKMETCCPEGMVWVRTSMDSWTDGHCSTADALESCAIQSIPVYTGALEPGAGIKVRKTRCLYSRTENVVYK